MYLLDRDDSGNTLARDEDENIIDRSIVARKVAYLLDNDRYLCDPEYYNVCLPYTARSGCTSTNSLQVCRIRFSAPQLADAMFIRYFDGKRKIGYKDPDFIEEINGIFICLFATAIYHCLKAWETGLAESSDFKAETRYGLQKLPCVFDIPLTSYSNHVPSHQ